MSKNFHPSIDLRYLEDLLDLIQRYKKPQNVFIDKEGKKLSFWEAFDIIKDFRKKEFRAVPVGYCDHHLNGVCQGHEKEINE